MNRKILLFLALLLALGAGGWLFAHRQALHRQWLCHRIGSAANYEQAAEILVQFDAEPQRDEKLRVLMGGWGRGNARFDRFLLEYLESRTCSEEFLQAFSLEFAWRPEVLPRWAHYWAWQLRTEPAEECSSLRSYLQAFSQADPPRQLPWRDILRLQALFSLTGQSDLALRLKPDNWLERFRRWEAAESIWLPLPGHPDTPFPAAEKG